MIQEVNGNAGEGWVVRTVPSPSRYWSWDYRNGAPSCFDTDFYWKCLLCSLGCNSDTNCLAQCFSCPHTHRNRKVSASAETSLFTRTNLRNADGLLLASSGVL